MNLEFADLISIAVYVIMGLAMYRMASTNGLSRPWLAWIPLGTDYVMGSVAEKSDACLGRQGKSYRRILLGLAIAAVAGGIVLVVLGIIVLIALFADTGLDFRVLLTMDEEMLVEWAESLIEDTRLIEQIGETALGIMPIILVISVLGLAVAVVSIVYQVYYFIAMSRIFARYDPTHATLFTVLGIVGTLFLPTVGSLTVPIFMLCLAYVKKPVDAAGPNPLGDTYWDFNAAHDSPTDEGLTAKPAEENAPLPETFPALDDEVVTEREDAEIPQDSQG